jgi:hypothetical protein
MDAYNSFHWNLIVSFISLIQTWVLTKYNFNNISDISEMWIHRSIIILLKYYQSVCLQDIYHPEISGFKSTAEPLY